MPDREPSDTPAEQPLATAVRASAIPVALLDLASLRLVAISRPGATMLGLDASAEGTDVRNVLPEDETTRRSLEELRSGLFDAYQARRTVRRADGQLVETMVWTRVIDEERTLAVVVAVEPGGMSKSAAEGDAAVGILDKAHSIQQISSDVTPLLGYLPEACIGIYLEKLVHQSDVGALLEVLSRVALEQTNLSINVRVRAADGSWRPVHLTVAPARGEATAFGLAVVEGEGMTVGAGGAETERVAQLEQHLARIAREVEAAGLVGLNGQILDPDRFTGLGELTARQWHILARLLRGERVPTIAKGMYLSPSTVRNHLSAIYKKLDVHSQAELIEKFRSEE